MVTGDVKMGHNTSGTWPLRIFPAHSRMVKLLRLLWLIEMSNLRSPQRDTQPKDAGNCRKGWILHFLSSHTLSVKACSLSLPNLWPEAKQNLNFPAWKEKSLSPSFTGSYHSSINCQAYSPPGHLWEGPHTNRLFSHMKDFPVRHTLFEIHGI